MKFGLHFAEEVSLRMFLMRETSGKVVVRTRLLARLDERVRVSEGRKLTLISAPAGFGKTTLVFAPSCIDIMGEYYR